MSSNEQHGNQGGSPGGWEPIPQSEGYDGDATAFVQLPPDFMLDGVPLEAPGHGYVPPMITPLQPLTPAATDPAATGTWTVHLPTQAEQTRYAEQTQYFDGAEYADQGAPFGQPAEYVEPTGYAGQPGHFEQAGHTGHTGHTERVEHFEQDPHATAEWRFTEVTAPAAASGTTGQWEIPVVPDIAEVEGAEPTEEPGEFAASSVRPYAEAPATLPGGAPAPWALPEEPAAQAVTETDAAGDGEPGASPEAEQTEAETEGPGEEPGEEPGDGPGEPDTSAAAHEDPAPASDPASGPNLAASTDSDEHPHTSYTLRVNGADRPVTGSWIGESLLYVLRERLGLAGAKDGCSQGECGACNVQVDGRLVASCLVPAATAAGSEVRTVEGLAVDGEPSDVQRAMAKCGTVQCGFCIPGMCMTVHDLLEGNHAPSELETRQALAGNLCRCSGYRGVLEAVRDVVSEREASAAAGAAEASDGPRVPHQIPHPHDGGMA
ncbi:2Fe-2S iron-sulfur cluster-binding protein [Streptomyces sp. NBC_00250]|uniref:(2Fe-2S)-binding protein n=1 Tax=Streptomyces sp. NBC_00250 TaxID=2903641 RepID=UPI002E27F816|nr:2Fe-2S iron-sulfur cluster-binding protein [Streptomyces sp. NBC_00250]